MRESDKSKAIFPLIIFTTRLDKTTKPGYCTLISRRHCAGNKSVKTVDLMVEQEALFLLINVRLDSVKYREGMGGYCIYLLKFNAIIK